MKVYPRPCLNSRHGRHIQRTAEGIDQMWQSIWDNSGRGQKIIIAIILIVTGLAIPVIPIVYLARFIAR